MRRTLINTISVITLLLPAILQSCSDSSKTERLIITRTSVSRPYIPGDDPLSWRLPSKAELTMVILNLRKKQGKLLTGDFVSACSPDVSYDGKSLLFAGKISEKDPWQIYVMELSSGKYRKILTTEKNCTDPLWLPGGKILFTALENNDTTGTGYRLFTCKPDGSDIRQVTYHPHADYAPSVMADGRVLYATRQLYPHKGIPHYYIMRPDGTKADKYFEPLSPSSLFIARAREDRDGNVYFIESPSGSPDSGQVASVHRNRPLFTRKCFPAYGGHYKSLFISNDGTMLVSFRPAGETCFSIFRCDIPGRVTPEKLYSEEGYDLIDVVVAEEHPRQKKLPSEVDYGVKTGQIMCQDINIVPEISAQKSKNGKRKAVKVEILGPGISMGIVDAEEDGSFYLKPLSDMPFRILTLDGDGNIVSGPSGWIWLKPNERRGCVGCHEDPELVPENRVPFAVKKMPVIIPIHIEKIKEKSVELE